MLTNQDGKLKLLLFVIAIICYGNTIWNEYALDDHFAVTENAYVQKGFRGIPELLTNSYYTFRGQKQGYMPVSGIILAVEYQFFGQNPHVSHAVNVILFGLLLLLMYSVLSSVFKIGNLHPLLPFAIVAIYAVHPAFTEVVASIKNRSEILSLIFALLGLRFSHRFFTGPSQGYLNAGLAILFLALSFLSKMVTAPFVAIIIMMGVFYGVADKKKFYSYAALLLLCTVGFVVVTFSFSSWITSFVEHPLVHVKEVGPHLALAAESLLFYFKFMLLPFPHRFYYGYNVIPVLPLSSPVVIFSILLHLTVLVAGIFLFRRKNLAGFFMLAYLGNIFAFCNKEYAGIVGERVLFIPGLWYITAFILLMFQAGRFKREQKHFVPFQKLMLAGGAIIFVLCCGFTIHRNFQWKDGYTLMTSDMPYLKNSAMGNMIFGRGLISLAEEKKGAERIHFRELAKKYFRLSLEVHEDNFEPNFQLGMIYEYEEQKRDSAFYFFQRAYNINPYSPTARFQLGKQYFLKGDLHRADTLFSKVYSELPQDTLTLFFYVQVLYNSGKEEGASAMNADLLRLAPDTYYPYYNYGMFSRFKGNMQEAAGYLQTAVDKGYRGAEVYGMLADYYSANGMDEKLILLNRTFQK